MSKDYRLEGLYTSSRFHTFPTDGNTLDGGATSFSRSSLAMRWWSGPTGND